MQKITVNNLVPCTRDYSYRNCPCHDLTHNYLLATHLIRAARIYFQLRRGRAEFSGYVVSSPTSPFTIKLMHKGKQVQIVVLKGLGYGGVLYVDLKTEHVWEAIGLDVLGSLRLTGVHGEAPIMQAVWESIGSKAAVSV